MATMRMDNGRDPGLTVRANTLHFKDKPGADGADARFSSSSGAEAEAPSGRADELSEIEAESWR
jgi:hypothetical protein